MGCTPSKESLEKQTGDAPGDPAYKKTPKRPSSPPSRNGEVKKTNGATVDEIKPQSAPVVTVTPNGDRPESGLNISGFSNLPDDIPFIDDDVESKRGSVMFPDRVQPEAAPDAPVVESSPEVLPEIPLEEPPKEDEVVGEAAAADDDEAASKRKNLEDQLEALMAAAEAVPDVDSEARGEVTEESIEGVVAGESHTEVTLIVDGEDVVPSNDRIAEILNQLDAAASEGEEQDGEREVVITETKKEIFTTEDGETSVVTKETVTVVKTEIACPDYPSEDEGGADPATEGAQLEDRFYNNKAFEQPDIDPSDPQQQGAAVKIQTKYRQHAAKQEVQTVREEQAAVKIQAGIRGYHDRNRVKKIREDKSEVSKQVDEEAAAADAADAMSRASQPAEEEEVDIDLNDPDVAAAATKIQAGFKGYKARKEVQDMKEDEEVKEPVDLADPEVADAAVTIQAGVKGMVARQDVEAMKEAEAERDPAEEEVIDIDLTDPDVNAAASKIQAGFKGMKTRKELKTKSDTSSTAEVDEPSEAPPTAEPPVTEDATPAEAEASEKVDIDLTDPEMQQAAAKIQAGYKGFKTRQDMKSKKEEGGES